MDTRSVPWKFRGRSTFRNRSGAIFAILSPGPSVSTKQCNQIGKHCYSAVSDFRSYEALFIGTRVPLHHGTNLNRIWGQIMASQGLLQFCYKCLQNLWYIFWQVEFMNPSFCKQIANMWQNCDRSVTSLLQPYLGPKSVETGSRVKWESSTIGSGPIRAKIRLLTPVMNEMNNF